VAKKKAEPRGSIRRVTIRLPSDLHEELLHRRDETGESLNDMLVEATARLLGLPVPEIQKGIPGRKPRRGSAGGKATK
jgi:hypothetical protein